MQTMYAPKKNKKKNALLQGRCSEKRKAGDACIDSVEEDTGWTDVAGYVCVCRCALVGGEGRGEMSAGKANIHEAHQ